MQSLVLLSTLYRSGQNFALSHPTMNSPSRMGSKKAQKLQHKRDPKINLFQFDRYVIID